MNTAAVCFVVSDTQYHPACLTNATVVTGFEVSAVLKIHTVFLWFVTLSRQVGGYQYLQGLDLS